MSREIESERIEMEEGENKKRGREAKTGEKYRVRETESEQIETEEGESKKRGGEAKTE